MYFLKRSFHWLFQRFHGELLLLLPLPSGRMRHWLRCPRQHTLARISAAPPLGSLSQLVRCNLVRCAAVFCFSPKWESENVYAKQTLRARAGEVQTNGKGNFRRASQRREKDMSQHFQEDARVFKRKKQLPVTNSPRQALPQFF